MDELFECGICRRRVPVDDCSTLEYNSCPLRDPCPPRVGPPSGPAWPSSDDGDNGPDPTPDVPPLRPEGVPA